MPEVFLDTDVSFDIISKREPFYAGSVQLLHMAANGTIQLVISETSLANLFYLSFDIYKIKDAASRLSDFISVCDLVHCGKEVAIEALISPFRDKEDALQYHAALNAGVDYFITRNLKDYKYKRTILPVLTPDQFCKLKFD